MEKHVNCYTCGKSGHYSNNCPQNPSSSGFKNKKRKTSSSSNNAATASTSDFPPTYCRCGGGLCKIKLIPKTQKPFYSCPNSYEMHCGYFKYCEMMKKEEILHERQSPYPCCPCGAGVCRLETEKTQGPNYGRKYFACRIPKGQGACNYWQWQEDYYRPAMAAIEDTIACDETIANDINMILQDLQYGVIELDYPCSPLAEIEVNASDETLSGVKETHPSPLPSPNTPLDAAALGSNDSYTVVVKWMTNN